jgi:hypothetical protein
MIRMVMGVAAVALLATACGAGGGKAAIVAKCVKEDGQSQKVCQCMADKVEKAVDKDVFRAIVLEAEGKVEESEKLMASLPMEKQMTAMGALSAIECMNLQ